MRLRHTLNIEGTRMRFIWFGLLTMTAIAVAEIAQAVWPDQINLASLE